MNDNIIIRLSKCYLETFQCCINVTITHVLQMFGHTVLAILT